ncbi:chloride channel protein [Thermococcus argininiproducens]|uniref:Chloride channel protein n=1 Tax=Thermococcus argininiproducens TaxID=2866384 RepID=A0A9E7MBN5_9EURY|nr:chloride channel protein [Thermococcus argininiproducens]USH00679.1 chloride channel protein [Thermococcus argininiproducens]
MRTEKYIKKWSTILLLSIITGVIGGLGAVVFRKMVAIVRMLFFGSLLPRISFYYHGYNFGYIFLPAIGSLLIVAIIRNYPELKGNGIPEVIEAVIFKKGEIKGKLAFLKALATSITIGSGGSVGREGPIGFIGASLASALTQAFKLSPETKKLLTTCGLAAGIAGTFNTPFAGAMFALEVVYMGVFSINLVPIFLSAVVGNAVTLILLGEGFEVTLSSQITYNHVELPLLFLMGLIFGLLAAYWAKFIFWLTDKFEKSRAPLPFKLFIGGLGVGVIGMFFPKYGILGVGYEGIELAIAGLLPLTVLIFLGIGKMLATSLMISTGHSGGIFAPSLYTGALLGAAYGKMLSILFPTLGINTAVYALAGMAAFFSGLTQAPINQILMVAELTRGYALLPCVITSTTTSFLTARFILRGSSVYTLKLERRGFRIKTGRPVVLETIPVKDIMTTNPIFVNPQDRLIDIEHLVAHTGHDCFPVVNEKLEVLGIVGIKDFLNKPQKVKSLPIERFLRKNYAVGYLNETAHDAFEKLIKYDQNLLPIVESPECKKLIGVVTKRDIYKAYYRALQEMYIEEE